MTDVVDGTGAAVCGRSVNPGDGQEEMTNDREESLFCGVWCFVGLVLVQ